MHPFNPLLCLVFTICHVCAYVGSYNDDSVQQYASIEQFRLSNPGKTEPLYRIWLTEAYNTYGAKCLDGSMPALYLRPGTGNGTTKFQIYLDGGGWCAGIGESVSGFASCYQRALNQPVGSSKTWLPYMSAGGHMSDDPAVNPLSYNWNLAFLKYCDGASFAGNNETTATYNNLTIYFRGYRILNGALDLLKDGYGFATNSTTDVILSGGSAGALAVFFHAQYVYDEWIDKQNTRFMGMPDAGFFLEYQGPHQFASGMEWVYYNQNVSIAMNKQCMEHYDINGWQCMFSQNISPFIILPLPSMFALQSRYDSFQIKFELDVNASNSSNDAAINVYGMNVTTTFINDYIYSTVNQSTKRGAFFDACSHHCQTSWTDDNITIDNVSAKVAAQRWYYNNDPNAQGFWFGNEKYPCQTCGCPE